MNENYPAVIENFLTAYEQMDLDAMSSLLSDNCTFLNIQHGEATHGAKGQAEWLNLAKTAIGAISNRRIVARKIEKVGQYWMIDGRFEATLANDKAIEADVIMLFHLHGDEIVSMIDIA